jgi:SH3 domain protein
MNNSAFFLLAAKCDSIMRLRVLQNHHQYNYQVTRRKHMDRFRLEYLLVAILAVFLFSDTVFAAKAYTTDTQEVPLLSEPGKGKTILMIPAASAVEPVNPNGYTHVRFTKQDGQVRDGWVQSKFLGARPPDAAVERELGAENASLKEQLDSVQQEKTALSQKEKELTDKLTQLNKVYEDLKAGSSNFLKFKAECDQAKTDLASAQDKAQNCMQENENLKFSERVRYFGEGAFILLLGLFLGWLSGRRQKKRKSNYY